jgi:hypothetical protein
MRFVRLAAGLVLALAGLLACAELAAFALDRPPLLLPVAAWLDGLRAARFDEPEVVAACGGLALIGLIVLPAALAPRPRPLARLADDERGRWWVAGRALERATASELERETPATAVKARLQPGRRPAAAWQLKVAARADRSEVPAIERTARAGLERFGAPGASRVRVRVRRPKAGSRTGSRTGSRRSAA